MAKDAPSLLWTWLATCALTTLFRVGRRGIPVGASYPWGRIFPLRLQEKTLAACFCFPSFGRPGAQPAWKTKTKWGTSSHDLRVRCLFAAPAWSLRAAATPGTTSAGSPKTKSSISTSVSPRSSHGRKTTSQELWFTEMSMKQQWGPACGSTTSTDVCCRPVWPTAKKRRGRSKPARPDGAR